MPKIRRFISVTFNVRSAKKLPSGLLQKKKIEVIIIVYIAKRSYAENAQTTFSIFARNVLNRYDYPVPLTFLMKNAYFRLPVNLTGPVEIGILHTDFKN